LLEVTILNQGFGSTEKLARNIFSMLRLLKPLGMQMLCHLIVPKLNLTD